MRTEYLIIGGGLAGASAAKGIREIDKEGSIILFTSEAHLPYHRPPLTKGLWTGKKKTEEIFVESGDFYSESNIKIELSTTIVEINPALKRIGTDTGKEFFYNKLLIATGGTPRRLSIQGGELEDVCYFRNLDDFNSVHSKATQGASAVVIGGGFIGSEISASLSLIGVNVIQIFPDPYLCRKVFPVELGTAIMGKYQEHGVELVPDDTVVSIEKRNKKTIVRTRKEREFRTDMVITGIGIVPGFELARDAGLQTSKGVIVNELLQTSNPDIYAAGDVALFPYEALQRQMRVEHWDNALNQGFHAGKNMAGLSEPYTYMPYFFSDLYEFGYEAVGDVNSELAVVTDWKDIFNKGILYYQNQNRIVGVMLCNVWGKTEFARNIIRNKDFTTRDLSGAIPFE